MQTAAAPTAWAPVAALRVPSDLGRRLDEGRHTDTVRAFVLARRTFLAGERVDMNVLASTLGVDRTSLFRWLGNREALMSEVLWSLAEPTLTRIERSTTDTGAARITRVLAEFVATLIEARYFQDFLKREPTRALSILTRKDSQVQRRYLAAVEAMLEAEVEAGRMRFSLTVHDLAYLLVRISESFTYADLITGEQPSATRARAAFEYVLREP
ncbi:TetR family transcriptional regulator [Frondihabitans australicus]|uniref:TetR family transcriptional regulator n=2 Tax=Frondihabitans australicus TaxID=386892 RepID=A0A495IGV5_9MICO|nr:TetR family transcriptional regulator [Frondihabitans australicus]